MLISDSIAKMIEEMLSEADGMLELRRNDLADKLGCVPSQINYVITSRFTPERGYVIESRRGGGGYIRITKVQMQKDEYLMHFFHAIGNALDARTANRYVSALCDNRLITPREKEMLSLLLPSFQSDADRADTLRQIILLLMK